MFKKNILVVAMTLFASAWCVAAPGKGETVFHSGFGKYKFVATTNCPDARAEVGDEVKIGVTVNSELPGAFTAELFVDGISSGEPRIFEFGKVADFSVKTSSPGLVSVRCAVLDADRKPLPADRKRRSLGLGVLVSPEKIVPGNPNCPADFDAFWAKKRAELDAVPLRATRHEVSPGPAAAKKYPGVVCYGVKVDCAGGRPVSGYLCMPRGAKPKSLPAIVSYHVAGVRSSKMQINYGRTAIAFNVNAHGIENGQPQKFYDDLRAGALSGYAQRGFDDRNHIYFVGMYMRVMRALDYVKSLPEWDGKTLIVCGNSQGGAQTIAAAALDPQVTLAVAGVPALCDLGGQLANHRPGWPLYSMPLAKQKDAAVIREAAYVDGVFLARRIKCPIHISTGGIDRACTATGVYAAFNSLPAKDKHIVYVPMGGHSTSKCRSGWEEIHKQLGIQK